MANAFDPSISKRLNYKQIDFKFDVIPRLASSNSTANEWVNELRENYHGPLNFIFAVKSTGEIGYTMTGKFPVRKFNVL